MGQPRALEGWEHARSLGRPPSLVFREGSVPRGSEKAEKVQKPEVSQETAEGDPEQMLICFSIPFFSLQEMSRFAEQLLA